MKRHRLGGRAVGGAAVVSILVAGVVAEGAAFAALPFPSSHYAGRGKVCEDNTPHHRYTNCLPKRADDHFSFRTSVTRRRVTGFAGTIGPLFCGGGTNTINVKAMAVKPDGRFSDAFSVPNRGPNGQVNGTSYVTVRGKFTSATSAAVFYRLVTDFKNAPAGANCGAEVIGTAHLT
jgi:hypothetical protein